MAMMHEFEPEKFDITFHDILPEDGDRVLLYFDKRFLAEVLRDGEDPEIRIPRVEELLAKGFTKEECRFLFTVGGEKYFLLRIQDPERIHSAFPEGESGLRFVSIGATRSCFPMSEAYAAAVGAQLSDWYRDTRFCSRCATPLIHSNKERAMLCPSCRMVVYPRINPSIIVGVIRGSGEEAEILGTRYNPAHVSNPNEKAKAPRKDAEDQKEMERLRRLFQNYALVAGYIETGESPEMTVEREVLEEVGLHVKNIRPFKNQPWPYAAGLLLGYVCEADPNEEVVLEEAELREAKWLRREDLKDRSWDRSLTSAIQEAFRKGEI